MTEDAMGIEEEEIELNTANVKVGCHMCNGEMISDIDESSQAMIDSANATSDNPQ